VTRRGLIAVVALVLGVFAASLTGGAPGLAADRPTAADLESQLVCPTCRTTLDESDAPIARRMKAYIRRRLAEGATGGQIKKELVLQFGEGVLSTPPTHGFDLLAWVLPIAGIGVGAVGLGALAWAWSRRRVGDDGRDSGEPADGVPLDPEVERRIDDELARFED
jgi:cytochrome c-type biogenesis protein CcmH